MSSDPGDVSQLLRAWGKGDVNARESLVPLVYAELRARRRVTCGASGGTTHCNRPRSFTRPMCG